MRAITQGVLSATITCTLVIAGAGVARAEPDPSANDVASIVNGAAPAGPSVLDDTARGGAGEITLDPEAPITLTPPGGATPVQVAVELPADLTFETGKIADDGTVVFPGTDGSVDAAVQNLSDGTVRITTIMNDANAPELMAYPLPDGVDAQVVADGSVLLTMGGAPVGTVAKPWAYDSDGTPVATSFRVEDGALVQAVAIAGDTVFPVVADPTWKWWGAQYALTHSQAQNVVLAVTTGAGVAGVTSALAAAGIVTAPIAGVAGFVAAVMSVGGGILQWCASPGKGMYLNFFYTGQVTCTQRK